MNLFLKWLYESPIASALKVALSASLVWVVDNAADLNLAPVVTVALIAALPVLINALNPEDPRYGRNVS